MPFTSILLMFFLFTIIFLIIAFLTKKKILKIISATFIVIETIYLSLFSIWNRGIVLGIIVMIGVVFLVSMILIIWAFNKKKIKIKNFKIIISLLLIVFMIFSSFIHIYKPSRYFFTKTTNLSEERIADIQLYQSINGEEFTKKYGTNLKKINNALLDYFNLQNGLEIATNKENQVIRIINSNNSALYKTSKGIYPGSAIDEVIKAYGPNYYKRTEEQIPWSPVIGYVDQKRRIKIEFWNYNNKVVKIIYDISSMQ